MVTMIDYDFVLKCHHIGYLYFTMHSHTPTVSTGIVVGGGGGQQQPQGPAETKDAVPVEQAV